MSKHRGNIYIIPNLDKDIDLKVTSQIVQALARYGAAACFDHAIEDRVTAQALRGAVFLPETEILSRADCVIVLGGDGTMLRAAQGVAMCGLPMLGINLGNIGYMTQLEANELSLLEQVVNRQYEIDKRMMLEIKLEGQDGEIRRLTALNDAVISKAGMSSGLAELELLCNGSRIISYRADGVIIATPTGSTAYSFSAGGPIVDPSIEIVMATPISPHSLFNRSIIFEGSSQLVIRVCDQSCEVALNADGQLISRLTAGGYVTISKSEHKANFISLKNNSFYKVLREKLKDSF